MRCRRGRETWPVGDSALFDRVPCDALLRQLFVFSGSYDVGQAAERIARCSAVLYTEEYDTGVAALGQRLGLELQARRERVTGQRTPPSAGEYDRLRSELDPEYELLRQLRESGVGDAGNSAGY